MSVFRDHINDTVSFPRGMSLKDCLHSIYDKTVRLTSCQQIRHLHKKRFYIANSFDVHPLGITAEDDGNLRPKTRWIGMTSVVVMIYSVTHLVLVLDISKSMVQVSTILQS